MSRDSELQKAIAELGRYYGVVSSSNFMALLLGYAANPNGNLNFDSGDGANAKNIVNGANQDIADPINSLVSGLISIVEGGSLMNEFMQDVDAFLTTTDSATRDSDIFQKLSGTSNGSRLFTVTYETVGKEYTSKDVKISDMVNTKNSQYNKGGQTSSYDNPGLATIQFHHPALNFSKRDSGAAAVFLNALPTIEISKCVPYVDVQVISARKPVEDSPNGGERIGDGISLFKFLNGRATVGSETEKKMITGLPANILSPSLLDQTEPEKTTVAGMEVFTSPQTLVNGNEQHKDLGPYIPSDPKNLMPARRTSVADKFRPFMTLESLSVSITPTVGTLTTKQATMAFKLHDRSRLHEIADLVTPQGLKNVELMIEYGWSHPDPTTPYGMLINSMRAKEKFGVMNSSYSFDDVGQCSVTLNLFSKGAHETSYKLISDDQGADHPLTVIKDVIAEINEAKKKLRGFTGDSSENIFPDTVMGKVNSVGSLLSLSPEDLQKLKKEVQNLRRQNSSNKESVTAQSMKAVSESFEKGIKQMQNYQQMVDESLKLKFEKLRDQKDPYLKKKDEQPQISTKTHCSFAKIALNFIAAPIVDTGKFTEVQCLFYPLNEFASFARVDDVGSFPINRRIFEKELAELRKKSTTQTIGQFVGFMKRLFFANMATEAYGFESIYSRDDESGAAKLLEKYEKKKEDGGKREQLSAAKEAVLTKAYGAEGDKKFRKPQIQIYIECVPAKGNDSNSICRLHFFDAAATAYTGFYQLWNAVTSDAIGVVNKTIMGKSSKNTNGDPQQTNENLHEELFRNQLSLLKELDILEEVQSTRRQSDNEEIQAELNKKYIRIKGGPDGLRYMFTRNMPSIKYGSEYSGILSANVSTNSDPQMQVIHMQRSQNKGDTPNGEVDDGLPLTIFPISLSMESFGCPILHVNQQFFVDFQTGTTADNVYAISGVDHSISPSDFKTSIKMVPLMASGVYNSLLGNMNKAMAESDDLEGSLSS